MNYPSLTILVCVKSQTDYHDQLLLRALDSLEGQTYKNFETLIICDKCWSKTKDLINSQHFKLNPTIVENTEGEGLYWVKNLGLSMITTELVTYLDADDYVTCNKIQEQIKYMTEHPEIDFLGVMGLNFDDAHPEVFNNVYEFDQYETHEQIAGKIFQENMIIHGGIMFKYSAVKALGGYRDIRRAEDWDLWTRAIIAGYRFAILQERHYFYSLGSSVPQ